MSRVGNIRLRGAGIARAVLAAVFLPGVAFAATTVDVMFAYDQSAARWLSSEGTDGGDLAARLVEKMNSVLPATHLDEHFTFRLAGVMTSAAEASGSGGWDRMAAVAESVASMDRGAATGAWKDIQAARDRFKADIVVVLVDSGSASDGTGGVSWKMSDPTKISKFAPWAYSVCDVQYVDDGDGYVVTHEVGHVMGAGHSDLLVDDPGPQLFPYSSAYHFVDGGRKWHTIMGYSHTSGSDGGYGLYPAFSSAEYTTPDGVALGDATHDNTRTLRETCVAVSKFRISGNEGGASGAKFTAKTVAACKVVDAQGNVEGVVHITVAKTDKKGQSKVSAVFYGLDGKKKASKAVKEAVSIVGGAPVVKDVKLELKGAGDSLVVTMGADGSVSGTFGSLKLEAVKTFAKTTADPRFRIAGMPSAIGGMVVLNDVESGGSAYHLVPDGEGVAFSASGRKWVFAKPAKVKYAKNKSTKALELVVDLGKGGANTNLSGLKLSVNAKTGVFKGSFTVYLDAGTPGKPKLKKMKFKVTGVLVDGIGSGRADCKGCAVKVALGDAIYRP